jgi:HPt (histidine-containing phosphotransfer) domain-containing protein
MDDYIAKPVRSVALYAAVEAIVPHTGRPLTAAQGVTAISVPANAGDDAPSRPLDWQQALEQLDENESLLQHMAEIFFEEAPRLMENIRQAMVQGNTTELHRAAHTLKGSAAVFAAGPTVAAALRLETIGREGPLTEADDALSELEQAMAQLLPALQASARGRDDGAAV